MNIFNIYDEYLCNYENKKIIFKKAYFSREKHAIL